MMMTDDQNVREGMRQAWLDSQPGMSEAHEEGGFVVHDANGSKSVERWPVGAKKRIFVPEHVGGRRNGLVVVATFHTHPTPNYPYRQEPSRTDILGVREDPDLAHEEYQGEYVIATELTYLIRKSGDVEVVGRTVELLRL
jgi:hypothetical protein